MNNEEFKELNTEVHHKRKDHPSHKPGPKTFRRGRAIAFFEMMQLRRLTLIQQLDAPEFQSINQILIGELKALDLVISEFSQLFEIHQSGTMEALKNNREET